MSAHALLMDAADIASITLFASFQFTAKELDRIKRGDGPSLHDELKRNRQMMTRFCFEPLLASTLMIGEPFSLSARRTPPDERDIIWLHDDPPKIPPLQSAEDFERETERELARFPLVKFDDVALTTTSFYRVKGLLPAYGLVVIWGAPKCGKSFWAFDLLMHVALGWEYRGLRVKAGPVVYCALEGKKGFSRRLEAFRRGHSGSEGAQFYLMFLSLDLIRDHKALIDSIRAQLPEGVRPAAVAIDTLNRSLFGSESSDQDMPAYVRAAEAVGDAFNCVVPIVHHCGHNGDRPRGHSSLLGGADELIAVKRDAADNIVATIEDTKDGVKGLEIVSRLVVVELGKDDDGDEMTSCVIEPVGEIGAASKASTTKPKFLTKTAKIALRALHMTIDELGEVQASTHIPAGVRAVTVEQWRSFAYKSGICTSDKAHSKGVAFNRGSEALLDANKIGIWDPYVWPIFQVEK